MKAVIIGAGEVGFNLAKKMSQEGKNVLLVEQDYERWKFVDEVLEVKTICRSGSDPSYLKEIELEGEDIVMAVTDSDEVNMIACFIAGQYSAEVIKIARIRNHDYQRYPEIFGPNGIGIDLCINPEELAAKAIYQLIKIPGTTDVIDFADGKVKLIGVKVDRDCPIIGKHLYQIKEDFPDDKILIAAIHRKNDVIVPSGNDIIALDDTLFIVVEPVGIAKVMKVLGKKDPVLKRLMIMGGGYLGSNLTKMLTKDDIVIKIIEKDRQRCECLSEDLTDAVIVFGDATDQSLLEEENISEIDMFIALTSDDEANILASLQAKQFGVDKVITLINKTNYVPLVSTIGVDIVISPRQMTVSRILQFVRKGIILSVTTLKDDKAEAIEFIAMRDSTLLDKPLKELSLPKGAIVGAIERNHLVIIPGGDDTVQEGDRVFIFVLNSIVHHLENLIGTK